MNIDLILVCLQAIFICLHGVVEFVESKSVRKSRWLVLLFSYAALTSVGFFFPDQVKENLQLILFLLLTVVFLFETLGLSSQRVKLFLTILLFFLSAGLLYFQFENTLVWISTPVAFGVLFLVVKKWKDLFELAREYFLRAGMLITVLFMLEPVFVSVQQNLKPVPTIPTSSIINQQNFLLLGVLVLLVLGGYLWKENQDHKL